MKNIKILLAAGLLAAAALVVTSVKPAKAADVLGVGGTPGGSALAAYNLPTATTVAYGSAAWTNTINASTSFTNMTPITCGANKELYLQWRGAMDRTGTGTKTAVVWLYGNADGKNDDASWTATTTNSVLLGTWTVTLNGTTCVTVLGPGAANAPYSTALGTLPPYVYIGIISNSCATGNLTNWTITAFQR